MKRGRRRRKRDIPLPAQHPSLAPFWRTYVQIWNLGSRRHSLLDDTYIFGGLAAVKVRENEKPTETYICERRLAQHSARGLVCHRVNISAAYWTRPAAVHVAIVHVRSRSRRNSSSAAVRQEENPFFFQVCVFFQRENQKAAP